MPELKVDPNLIGYCGLYCGACPKYLKGSCPGCHENTTAGWCGIRVCNLEHEYSTCADCSECPDPNQCKKFNNLIAKVFGLVFNSNRQACVFKIRELGKERYAAFMTENKKQTIPRR